MLATFDLAKILSVSSYGFYIGIGHIQMQGHIVAGHLTWGSVVTVA